MLISSTKIAWVFNTNNNDGNCGVIFSSKEYLMCVLAYLFFVILKMSIIRFKSSTCLIILQVLEIAQILWSHLIWNYIKKKSYFLNMIEQYSLLVPKVLMVSATCFTGVVSIYFLSSSLAVIFLLYSKFDIWQFSKPFLHRFSFFKEKESHIFQGYFTQK